MHPLDILFWTCLMLGGAYTLVLLLMGGLTHAAGQVAHHIGDTFHLPQLSDTGGHDFGHVDAGGHDVGHVDAGGHADVAPHGDMAHDGVDTGHHADAHADHGDHHGDGEEGAARFNILAYLSPMSLSSFMLGFGGVGVISRLLGAPPLAGTLYAMAGGWGLWLGAYFLISRMFARAGGTSHTRREEVIGLRAKVTAPIEGSHPGMVCYVVAGTRQQVRAITDDGETIPIGAQVRIRRIEANTAYVSRIDEDAMPLYNRLQ